MMCILPHTHANKKQEIPHHHWKLPTAPLDLRQVHSGGKLVRFICRVTNPPVCKSSPAPSIATKSHRGSSGPLDLWRTKRREQGRGQEQRRVWSLADKMRRREWISYSLQPWESIESDQQWVSGLPARTQIPKQSYLWPFIKIFGQRVSAKLFPDQVNDFFSGTRPPH